MIGAPRGKKSQKIVRRSVYHAVALSSTSQRVDPKAVAARAERARMPA
jgi:hypothetical protein